ncbi:MAG: hypothetical protein H6715_01225 [Myxococcales bacterium]|nr:hypothetical protein [Myxococcales bacterium]MCB9708917.1 hypothetical protein [Myxococcales bacterium]
MPDILRALGKYLVLISVSLMAMSCHESPERSSDRVTSYREEKSQAMPPEEHVDPTKRTKRGNISKAAEQKPGAMPNDTGPTEHLKEHLDRLDRAAQEQEKELERISGDLPTAPH